MLRRLWTAIEGVWFFLRNRPDIIDEFDEVCLGSDQGRGKNDKQWAAGQTP